MRPLEVDLTGQRMGRLTVLERGPNQGRKVMWVCRCDCGRTCRYQTFDILFGKVSSCGCYRRERQRDIHTKSQRNSFYKHHDQ